MKKKEIKNLAKKIAKAEYIIQNSDDKNAIKRAKDEILSLSNSIHSMEDMFAIDEEISEILNKKNISEI